jgi:hypothetical protein
MSGGKLGSDIKPSTAASLLIVAAGMARWEIQAFISNTRSPSQATQMFGENSSHHCTHPPGVLDIRKAYAVVLTEKIKF